MALVGVGEHRKPSWSVRELRAGRSRARSLRSSDVNVLDGLSIGVDAVVQMALLLRLSLAGASLSRGLRRYRPGMVRWVAMSSQKRTALRDGLHPLIGRAQEAIVLLLGRRYWVRELAGSVPPILRAARYSLIP